MSGKDFMELSRSRAIWAGFTFLSCIAAFLSYQYMGQVFSLVNVAITCDRHQVLADAQKLAEELQWNIAGYQNVTSFESEESLQCFVELEAGGKDAFVAMFQSELYHPFHWHVRFFKEQEIQEFHAWFSPQGKRLGFYQKISEQAPGKSLSKELAQALAEQKILDWCRDFNKYSLVEHDIEARDTGRVDHKISYERTDVTVGKGLYRLTAVVSGDVVSKIEPHVKIPDNFIRRYQQMRSANNLLASVGMFFFRLLYLLCFALLGFIFFYRRNYLLSRSSALAAGVVATCMLLRGLNEASLWWISYNTIQSSFVFIATKLFQEFVNFVFIFALLFLALVVAEAAGRFVYKHHIQFFQLYRRHVLGSVHVAEQVVLGYLMVPFFLGYVITFSYVTKSYWNWWLPAVNLSDPNVIASYFPWFGPLAMALLAGFLEEIAFRALPLAMTAVLTRNSKYKKMWMFVAFVLQIIIFSASHANYPNQPFYARLIELIFVSFGFGVMYLKFGLLPGIITHFVYDAVLMALPIFVSNLVWSKVIVIFFIGLPLWIVLALHVYNRGWLSLPMNYFNQGFVDPDYVEMKIVPRRIGQAIPKHNRLLILFLGMCSLFVWSVTYKFKPDTYALQIDKTQAVQIARQAIHDKFGADLDKSWTPIALVKDDCNSITSRFIWQVYGKDVYDLVQGSYLAGVSWVVRFVKFSGDVEDRGEEYEVAISSSDLGLHAKRQQIGSCAGHVMQALHKIPEHFAGADISEKEAEHIAYDFAAQEFLLQKEDFALISILNDQLDERRDWTIVLQDTQVFDFSMGGQARIKVKVSGDKISEYVRFIFVPEDWTRAEQAQLMLLGSCKIGLWFLMFLLIACGCLFGVNWLLQSSIGLQIMRHKAFFVMMVSVFYILNSVYIYMGSFNTAEPFYEQVGNIGLGLITMMSFQILFCAVCLAIGSVGFIRGVHTSFIESIALSISVAWIFSAVSSCIACFEPYLAPVAGNYEPAAHWMSSFAFSGWYVKIFYLVLSILVAMFVVLKTVRNRWPNHMWIQLLCTILFCISLQAMQATSSISWMFVHGIIIGCVMYAVYYLLLQYDMTLLPLLLGAFVIMLIIPELLYPAYKDAFVHALMASINIGWIAVYFHRKAHLE